MSVQLPAKTKDRLRKKAINDGFLNVSDAVRYLIHDYLKEERIENEKTK